MIPKTIHYVWVGGQAKPADIARCMATWQRRLPDYTFREWSEQTFDIHSHPFVEQAYQEKKWAYVSDYIRAYAVYHEGGIYLDTDVLVLTDFADFLGDRAFVGFENPDYPFTAVFGAEPGHPLLKDLLDYYDTVSFEFDRQDQMKHVNTKIVSNLLIEKYACQVNNQAQLLPEGIRVYPDTILCNPSAQSTTIHVFTGTWMEGNKPFKRRLTKWLKLRLTTQRRAGWYQKIFRG